MGWFDLLKAARKLNSEEGFTSFELGKEAKIVESEKSSAAKIASGWLSKFEKWGYVERIGTTGGRAWSTLWVLTNWGLDYEPGKRFDTMTRTGAPKKKATKKKSKKRRR